MNFETIKTKMNFFGKKGIPFLFIIDFEMNRPVVLPLEEVDGSKILYNVNNAQKNFCEGLLDKKLIFNKYPINYSVYKKAFEIVQDNITAGNTYLLNLTFPTRIETNLTLQEIFLLSEAKYKLFFNNDFIVFSPETFVRIEGKTIYSCPMKGTIDAEIKNAEEIILSDEKEKAEHNTIVDLIRNDLSLVAGNVRVEKFRYVEKIKTNNKSLLQVSSKVSGELPDHYEENIGGILCDLLPAGSISGAPKKKTLEIIKEAENYNRGYYTGIFGIFDGQNLDSAVMIRFIERIGEELYFKSGGGITYMSQPEQEYQELIDKVYVPII